MKSLPPEFALAVACCRWPRSDSGKMEIARLAGAVDWPLFLRAAARHRVEGLVWDGLSYAAVVVPSDIGEKLSSAATDIVRENMLIVGESFRLDLALRGEGVACLFLKGVTLAMLAYGTVSLKRGWDIDFLVPPDRVEAAIAALLDSGYRCKFPGAGRSPAALAKWHRRSKESLWVHDKGFYVELHTALADNARLLPGVDVHSPSQDVLLAPGRTLPTLARDELFAYLCVHGASSAWFRLKWVADLAAWLAPNSAEENERLYRRSQALGAGRAAAQALLLCDFLFGTPIPLRLREELQSDAASRWLFVRALDLMAGAHFAGELHHRRLGTLPIHLTQFALLPGLRFKFSELGRQLTHIGG